MIPRRTLLILSCAAVLTACPKMPAPDGGVTGVTPNRAAPGETITVQGTTRTDLVMTDSDGSAVAVTANAGTPVRVTIPRTLAGGSWTLATKGDLKNRVPLTVLNDTVDGVVAAVLSPGTDAQTLLSTSPEPFTLMSVEPLGGPAGLCAGNLALLKTTATDLGRVLTSVTALPGVIAADPVAEWKADPQSLWATGGNDASIGRFYLDAVVEDPQRPPLGEGVTIAVLDTGVTDDFYFDPGSLHLGSRYLQESARDFTGSGTTDDDFRSGGTQPDGHGSIVAAMAAADNESIGVARAAAILNVKVCDAEGQCRSDRVLQGICHAVTAVPPRQLVINLSLGGNVPIPAVRTALTEAIAAGAVVVAAVGNESPSLPAHDLSRAHYPASENLTGMVVVGALANTVPDAASLPQALWRRASTSRKSQAVDVSAPAVRVNLSVPEWEAYNGTSFAAPQAAAVLAIWRSECPALTPVQLEAQVRADAQMGDIAPADRNAVLVGQGLLRLPATRDCRG